MVGAASSAGGTAERRRAVLGDLCLGAFASIGMAITITADLASGAPGTRPPGPVAYGFAACLGVLMLVRRRAPVATLVCSMLLLALYYRLSYPPVGIAVPTAAASFSAAERGRLRWAIGSAVAFIAVTTAIRARQGDERLDFLFGYELVTAVTVTAAVIALGDALRSRRELRAESARREEQARQAHEQDAERRIAQERAVIAREVHDVVAHTVSVISIQADVAAESLDHGDPRSARSAIGVIRSSSGDALAELRSTLRLLRTPSAGAPREPLGGLEQLDRIVGGAADSGLDVAVVVEGARVPLPAVVDAAAHRIVQESVTNVLRHSGARAARIELCYRPDELVVRVTDDGRGGVAGPGGLGLTGMAERVEVLGGTLSAGPADGGGFCVEASLPIGVAT